MADARIKKIFDALDLGFSDIYDGENVRQQTLQEKLDTIEESTEIIKLEEAINFSILSSLGNICPAAEIYAIDFPSDLRASIYLLLGGYYKQAIYCLRNWYEMRLTGMYYSVIETNRSEYEEWKSGKKEEHVIGRGLIKRFFGKAEFHRADASIQLKDALCNLYAELSSFTHGAMLSKHDLQAQTDNVPRFNPQSVDLYAKFLKQTFILTTVCFLFSFGNHAFNSLEANEKATLKNRLPANYLPFFQQLNVF